LPANVKKRNNIAQALFNLSVKASKMPVSDFNVVSLTERRIARVRKRQAVTSDEGWRLIRAFRQNT
jgi:hypothetical protein